MTETLFAITPVPKPDFLAPAAAPFDRAAFSAEVERLRRIGEVLVSAWQAHPLFGLGLGEERRSNPMVRLEIQHAPGPRSGDPVSISFVRLAEAAGEMVDISRRLKTLDSWHFQVMPVQPTDPVFGMEPRNSKVYGDWFRRIPRFWDFPNRAGQNFVAKRAFVRRYPKLRKLFALARHYATHHNGHSPEARAHLAEAGVGRLPGKKRHFAEQVARLPQAQSLLADQGLTVDDLWAVATNRLTPEQVAQIGAPPQPALFA